MSFLPQYENHRESTQHHCCIQPNILYKKEKQDHKLHSLLKVYYKIHIQSIISVIVIHIKHNRKQQLQFMWLWGMGT
jgi:lysozyme family protein